MNKFRFYFLNKIFSPNEDIAKMRSNLDEASVKLLCEGICLNTTANPVIEDGIPIEQLGNKTECALLELAHTLKFKYKQVRGQIKVVRSVPFSSSRKKMTTVVSTDDPNRFMVYTKGAPDFLLPYCSNFIDENSNIQSITKEKLDFFKNKVIQPMAESSLRTLALAFTAITHKELQEMTDEELETDLTLVSIVGIKDPLRPGVKEAIKRCREAGITVRMVTGDNVDTAVAIARECGILPGGEISLEQLSFERTSLDRISFERLSLERVNLEPLSLELISISYTKG